MQYDENAYKYGYEGEMTPMKCDELKSYKGDVTIPVYGTIADAQVYLKSEADKVIADKDKEIEELKEQVHDYAQGLYVIQARAEKELRHHKYKRCLAMAKICENKLGTVVKPGWWDKWRKRWLELAEKFKEAK